MNASIHKYFAEDIQREQDKVLLLFINPEYKTNEQRTSYFKMYKKIYWILKRCEFKVKYLKSKARFLRVGVCRQATQNEGAYFVGSVKFKCEFNKSPTKVKLYV